MREPFTKDEKKVMSLLVEAHNRFIKLESTHAMEVSEWVHSFHKLQDLLGARVLRRDYPATFSQGRPSFPKDRITKHQEG
mgnify:CR=1 FL=1